MRTSGCNCGCDAPVLDHGHGAPFPDVVAQLRAANRQATSLRPGIGRGWVGSSAVAIAKPSRVRLEPWERGRAILDNDKVDLRGCYVGRRSVLSKNVAQLKDQCRIYIGEMTYRGDPYRLSAEVPRGYQPSTDKDAMFEMFFPEYMSADRADWTTLRANIVSNYQDNVEGCFWEEGGVMVRATLHALQMIAAGSMPNDYPADLKATFDDARETIRDGDLWLSLSNEGAPDACGMFISPEGRVSAENFDREPNWLGRNSWGTIQLAPALLEQAALADYLLWWAWRMHSRIAEGDGGNHEYRVGLACAKIALAEVGYIGAVILHECVHALGGIGGHCVDWFSKVGCPQDKVEMSWVGRAATLYNLTAPWSPINSYISDALAPQALSVAQGSADADEFREVWDNLQFIDGTAYFNGFSVALDKIHGAVDNVGADDGCFDGAFKTHVTYTTNGSTATVDFDVPEPCSKSGARHLKTLSL